MILTAPREDRLFPGGTGCSPKGPRVPGRAGPEATRCPGRRIEQNDPLMESPSDRLLLHLKNSRRLVVEPDEIYYLEAAGDETIVRRRGRQTLRDVRSLGELMAVCERFHFHRIHDKWAVNPHRLREIRPQRDGEDWEVVLRPPVNRVLPVSRRRRHGLTRRFGE